mgnify:CR=1 FL=1
MIPKIIQNPMRRFTAAVAVLLSLACAFSCKKEKGGGDTLEKIYFVDPASASMVLSQGQTGYIMYATVPESAAATAVMEWSSSDTNIAEVFNGQVTAIAPGNTVITVKCGNVSATLDVQVVPIPVTNFSVPKSMNAYMDMPTPIKLTVEPAEANAASLEWKSDNPEIAEVVIESGKAFVNAKKEGGCKITVTPYNNSEASQQISVTVYPAIFKLMRRSISGESSYVEILNDDSFDITDIGMPYEGIRCIEMIRLDGDKLLESSVEVNNENSGIVSITKRQRSESKVLLNVEEKSEVGATKVSVSLKEDDNVYTKTFTITRQKHDFTSDTKICRIYTETPVNDVEEMAREAILAVQMFPAVNAVWTSSNESVAKVAPLTSDGTGFSPMAEIRTFGEYGSAEITATDESGEHTRKFTVRVSKASFPAGTKIGTRVGGKLVPVGESTTLRASYDGRNDAGFGLMDASGNYLTTFTNFKWTIESPSCECRLSPVGASGVVVAPISTTTFSGSKTATLVCTDDAGNRLTHKIFIDSPNAFSGVQNLRVTVDGKSYTSNAKVDIGKTATIDIAKLTLDSSYDGLKWENVGVLGSVYGTTKLNNNSSGSLMSIEFTPNRKMEAMPISVEDEIGQVKKIYISSAKFHFPDGAKIYISYDKSKWNTLDERVFLNNGQNYFRVGTSATDFVKSDTPVEWSRTKLSSPTNYEGRFRALSSGDVSTYAISPMGYPDDYGVVYYFLSAKDDYGTVVRSKFVLKKFMNFNDGIWFRLQYAYLDKTTIKHKTLTYKFESGKDKYVTLPYNDYHTVGCSCSPSESGSSAYYNHAEIMDFDELPYSLRTEKPACDSRVWTIKEQYARITFYDDYGNKKAFYIIRK